MAFSPLFHERDMYPWQGLTMLWPLPNQPPTTHHYNLPVMQDHSMPVGTTDMFKVTWDLNLGPLIGSRFGYVFTQIYFWFLLEISPFS